MHILYYTYTSHTFANIAKLHRLNTHKFIYSDICINTYMKASSFMYFEVNVAALSKICMTLSFLSLQSNAQRLDKHNCMQAEVMGINESNKCLYDSWD